MRNVYVIEVTPAIDSSGTLKTFLFSSEGWATLPTDTPANTLVQARLDQPGNFRRELFSGNRTIGAVRPSFGECTLINTDGGLDDFARYGFDGRDFKLSYGPVGAAYPSGFTTLLKATLRGATFTMSRVSLIIRDRMELLDRPLSQTTFTGAGNEEGTSEMAGKRKPLAFGGLRLVRPQLLNETALLYSVGNPPAGYDAYPYYMTDGQGSQLDTAYHQPVPTSAWFAPSVSALMSASIAPGYQWSYPPLGLFRLCSKPAIDFCCSVQCRVTGSGIAGTPISEIGTLLSQMATMAGIPAIDSADVSTVDTAKDNLYGYHVESDETALAAMSNLASSAFCWFGMGADDILHMGVLDSPSGTPVVTLRSHDVTTIERLDGGDTNRLIPIWKATSRCSHNNVAMTNFAGSAPEWAKTYARKDWAGEVIASDTAVKDKHLYAEEMSVDVYGGAVGLSAPDVDGGAAAQAMTLYGVDRELVNVTMPLRADKFALFEIGAVLQLKFPRYGWDAGKLFRVVAIDANFGLNKLTVTIWG